MGVTTLKVLSIKSTGYLTSNKGRSKKLMEGNDTTKIKS